MKKVLLIGGSGYLGSFVSEYLTQQGFEVTDIDEGWYGLVKSQSFSYHDIESDELEKFDTAILLAGYSTIKLCDDNPSCIFHDVYCFSEFANKCAKTGVKLIYASSAAVYRNDRNFAKEYDILPLATSLYTFCMKSRDELVELIPDLKYYALRLGTLSGYSPNLRTDILINAFVESFKKFGHIKAFNPECYRALLSTLDAARAIEKILLDTNDSYGIYNLASENLNIKTYAYVTASFLKCHVEWGQDSLAHSFKLDCSKFVETFGFEFKHKLENVVQSLMEHWDEAPLKTTRNV